jgi:hypothetical protein
MSLRDRAMQLIDGVVEVFAPATARERQMARDEMRLSALLNEKSNNASPVSNFGIHPDSDLTPDTPEQRRRCTLAYYNNDLFKGIVDSEVRQICGSIQIQSHTGSPRVDRLIQDKWQRLMDDGFLERICQPAVRHLLVDGGSVAQPLGAIADDPDFEVIPYRRIVLPFDRTKNEDYKTIRDGFRYDESGRRIKSVIIADEEAAYNSVYYTGKTHEQPLFAHMALPRMAGQTKGLSWAHACIVRLEMINRWMNALLSAAELHASVVALVNAASKDATGIRNALSTGLSKNPQDSNQNTATLDWAKRQKVLFLPQGGDYRLLQANAPVIGEFLIWSLRFVARSLGVSFERLTYDLSMTSFSSTKFGDRDDRITVLEHQNILDSGLLQRANRRVLAGLFLRDGGVTGAGAYAANPEVFEKAVRFMLPGRPPVDELKAENANELALRNRTTSRTRIVSERGSDAVEVDQEIMREDRNWFDLRKKFYLEIGMDDTLARDLALEDIRSDQFSRSVYNAQPDAEADGATGGSQAPAKPVAGKKQQAGKAAA